MGIVVLLSKMKTFLLLILVLGVCHTTVSRELQAPVQKKPAKAGSCNLSKNGRCGVPFGNTRCVWGFCSKWNWCGTTAKHKATHQPAFDASPHCTKKAAKKQPKCNLSKDGKCGKAHGGTICPVGWCNKAGTCGTDKMHKAEAQRDFSASKLCSAKAHAKRKVKKAKKKAAKKVAKKAHKMAKNVEKVNKPALKAKKVVKAKIAIKKVAKAHKPKIIGKHTTTPKKPVVHIKVHKPKIIGKHTITPKKTVVHIKVHKPKIIGKHTMKPKKPVVHIKVHKPKIIGKHTTTPKKPVVHIKVHKPKII